MLVERERVLLAREYKFVVCMESSPLIRERVLVHCYCPRVKVQIQDLDRMKENGKRKNDSIWGFSYFVIG